MPVWTCPLRPLWTLEIQLFLAAWTIFNVCFFPFLYPTVLHSTVSTCTGTRVFLTRFVVSLSGLCIYWFEIKKYVTTTRLLTARITVDKTNTFLCFQIHFVLHHTLSVVSVSLSEEDVRGRLEVSANVSNWPGLCVGNSSSYKDKNSINMLLFFFSYSRAAHN